jgi:hypothetical protein
MDPKNWTTKIEKLDGVSGPSFGGSDGIEAEADRRCVEGESGVGGGAWGSHDERIGVAIRCASDADRSMEAAIAGRCGRSVFLRPTPGRPRAGGFDCRLVRADRAIADGTGVVEKKSCPTRLSSSGSASSRILPG